MKNKLKNKNEIKLDLNLVERSTTFKNFKWLCKRWFTFWTYKKVSIIEIETGQLKKIAKEKNMFINQMVEKLLRNYIKGLEDDTTKG